MTSIQTAYKWWPNIKPVITSRPNLKIVMHSNSLQFSGIVVNNTEQNRKKSSKLRKHA